MRATTALAASCLLALSVAASPPPRAIVMIVGDDYGWWNIEMDGHNAAARTPNMHALQKEGVRLDRHCESPVAGG